VKKLTDDDLLRYQRHGYFDEHLATLYSLAYGEPYIYKDTYLLYHDPLSKTLWLTLFELNSNEDKLECVQDSLDEFKPSKLITTSPEKLPLNIGSYSCGRVFFDKDYQINLHKFDEHLRGSSYKSLRYRVNNAKKLGYTLAQGKGITTAHSHLINLHMMKRNYNAWDYLLYLKINEYVKKFSSPRLFNVFLKDILIGFDVIDVLNKTMTTPLGFYLDYPSLADFATYNEVMYAKTQGFEWLDIGWACNSGLEEFKKKWMAIPRFNIWVQEYQKVDQSMDKP